MPEDKSDIANIYDNQAISEKPKKAKKPAKAKSGKKKLTKNRIKAKILSTYYGHPARDMKLIVVLFAELDIYAAVLTDYIPSRIGDASAEDYEAAEDTLFDMNPDFVILNRDDKHYDDFKKSFKGEKDTVTYGENLESKLCIESSKLYKMGSEAHLNYEGRRFVVASFLNKQTDISYMACAAAFACAVGADIEAIENGIASYDPQGITPIDAPKEETAEEPTDRE